MPAESSSLLQPEPKKHKTHRIGMGAGLTEDVHEAAADTHWLLFIVWLWFCDRVSCKPMDGDIEPARATSQRWREYKCLAAFNPIYWLIWLCLFLLKAVGRASVRLVTCNR